MAGSVRGVAEAGADALLGRIQERARAYFPELEGEVAVRLVEARRRPYSRIFRVSLDDGARVREVVVKSCARADTQFRAMTAVWRAFRAHPTLRIPHPLDCLDDCALVMDRAAGSPVLARLPWIAWAGRRLRAGESDCLRAGQWLRFYHDLGRAEEATFLEVPTRLAGFEASVAHLVAAGFDARPWRRLADHLERLGRWLVGRPLTRSHVHGEFTVDNVLVDERRVTGLDVWGEFRNAVAHDLASFLNSLLLVRVTRPAPWSALRRLGEAFLAGYRVDEPREADAIVFLQGVELADVIVEIVGRRRSFLERHWLEHVAGGAIETIVSTERGSRS